MPNPGGKLSRQPTDQTIIRDLESRVKKLEEALALVYSVGGGIPAGNPIISIIITPVTAVTIVHNRNRVVLVQVFDPSGSLIDVNVNCYTPNSVVITGEVAFSGTVIVM